MFTIHSSGDAAFLEQIIMAVAMVTSVGSFERMVGIGLLLGVVLIFVQSIMQGAREVNFQQVLLGYLLYALFFIPTTRVLIEDNYSGEVRVVDNAPLVIGAAGGIISSVGYGITNLFEQGYGVIVPYSTETGFAESLKILNDSRKRISSAPVFQALDQSLGGNADFRRSWHNYIRECTLTGIDLGPEKGGLRLDDVMSGELPDALRFNSSLYRTELSLGGAGGGMDYPTCSDAYVQLNQATNIALGNTNTFLSEALLNEFGIDNTYSGKTGQQVITESLGMLGQMGTEGTKFLTAAVLEPIYYEAAMGKYADFQDAASATMINQAIQQRNTQWAAEQSMFMTIVRPLMTFFEGFVYSITPLMAFLIMLGSFGISLAGRYFQTLLWIQLWLPVMSIINLYIVTSASRELSSIEGGLTSFYALNSAEDALQHWIATGGMLAASTPLISLFVVTGSTYALTSLAGRISGKDHIDEKVQSKDILSNGPMMQHAPSNQGNDLTGRSATGAEAMIGSISFGSGISSMMSSTQQKAQQSQQAFSEALGSSFSSSQAAGQSYDAAANLGRVHSASHGTSEGLVNDRAHQIMQSSSIGAEHADAVRGVVAAVGSGAISAEVGKKALGGMAGGKAGLQGNLSASAESSTTDTTKTSAQDAASFADGLSFNKAEQAQITNSLSQSVSRASTESLSQGFQASDTATLSQTAQDVVSSNRAYSEAASLTENASSLNNLNLKDVGASVSGNSQAMAGLNSFWNTGGVSASTKEEANRLYDIYTAPGHEGGYAMDSGAALAASRIKALQNSNNHEGTSDEQYQRNFNAAVSSTATSLGLTSGQYGGYSENQSLRNVDNGNLEDRARATAGQAEQAVAPAKNITMPTAGYPEIGDPLSAGTPSAIAEESQRNSAALAAGKDQQQAERYAALEGPARQQFEHNAAEYSRMSAAEGFGGLENAADWTERRMTEAANAGQNIFDAASEGMTVASANFDERLEQIKNDPELRQQVIAASRMSDEEYKEAGIGKRVLDGFSSGGRSILGIAATGMELARGEIGFSDLKGLNPADQGAIYQAALAHAYETGGEAAAASLASAQGVDFHSQFVEEGLSRGLTAEQAAVYASAYDSGGYMKLLDPNAAGNSPERLQAIDNLAAVYAERDANGNVMRDENNRPVLTEDNQKFVDSMTHSLTEAARAGSTINASYLSAARHYNDMTGRRGQL